MTNKPAASLFEEYKSKTIIATEFYNRKVENSPGSFYPSLAAGIWRYGMLAEFWGSVATKLGKNKIDYLDEWRNGK